jgi:hypothetical protein
VAGRQEDASNLSRWEAVEALAMDLEQLIAPKCHDAMDVKAKNVVPVPKN